MMQEVGGQQNYAVCLTHPQRHQQGTGGTQVELAQQNGVEAGNGGAIKAKCTLQQGWGVVEHLGAGWVDDPTRQWPQPR